MQADSRVPQDCQPGRSPGAGGGTLEILRKALQNWNITPLSPRTVLRFMSIRLTCGLLLTFSGHFILGSSGEIISPRVKESPTHFIKKKKKKQSGKNRNYEATK